MYMFIFYAFLPLQTYKIFAYHFLFAAPNHGDVQICNGCFCIILIFANWFYLIFFRTTNMWVHTHSLFENLKIFFLGIRNAFAQSHTKWNMQIRLLLLLVNWLLFWFGVCIYVCTYYVVEAFIRVFIVFFDFCLFRILK